MNHKQVKLKRSLEIQEPGCKFKETQNNTLLFHFKYMDMNYGYIKLHIILYVTIIRWTTRSIKFILGRAAQSQVVVVLTFLCSSLRCISMPLLTYTKSLNCRPSLNMPMHPSSHKKMVLIYFVSMQSIIYAWIFIKKLIYAGGLMAGRQNTIFFLYVCVSLHSSVPQIM